MLAISWAGKYRKFFRAANAIHSSVMLRRLANVNCFNFISSDSVHWMSLVRHFTYYDHSDIIILGKLHFSGGNSMHKVVITLRITYTTFCIVFVLLLIYSVFLSSNRTTIQSEARFPLICSRDILAATLSATNPSMI